MSETHQSSSPLSCAVVVELLPGFAEGSLNQTAEDAVRQHVDTCGECRESLDELVRGEGLGAVVVPAAQTGRVPAVGLPRARQRRWPPQWWGQPRAAYSAVALAGLIGVGALGGLAMARAHSRPPQTPAPDLVTMLIGQPAPPAARSEPRGADIVALTGVGNDETRHSGFSLRRSIPLRVHAVGEGSGGQMYDYAWISNAHTFEPVWIMDYHNTDHAGGADKNRVADHVVRLPEGDYVLHYTTDDSHAAHAWNSSPPHHPERWGVSLTVENARDARYVSDFDPSSIGNVFVRLVGARDNSHMRGAFELNRETDIRVYAMGEGTGGEMHDYAWIEDANTKRIVWQMNYDETHHAGGAEKNRMVNEIVRLPAGHYVAYYVTDGSHSFEGWNSDAPRDPTNYGVTILRVER